MLCVGRAGQEEVCAVELGALQGLLEGKAPFLVFILPHWPRYASIKPVVCCMTPAWHLVFLLCMAFVMITVENCIFSGCKGLSYVMSL